MRAFIASSIGVTCAAVLALPLAVPAGAAPDTRTVPAESAGPVDVPGSTQSLPMWTLSAPSGRSTGDPTRAAAPEQGLPEREVHPFSLVGVVWDDANAELHGTVQVRTRATGTGAWSDWQDLETHNAEHSADPGTAERDSGTVRGSTAPLWVGDSDAVAVRVRPEAPDPQDRTGSVVPLPAGLRLELVDPGKDPQQLPATDTGTAVAAAGAVSAAGAQAATTADGRTAALSPSVLPALSKARSEAQGEAEAGLAPGAQPYIGPRPRIVTRKGWGADEKLRERKFVYTGKVKAAFIHHSATGNNYKCSQAPSVLRGIYRYHVKSSGWRDIGYNFAVDKCGNIYEGRAGGVTKAVLGAHTLGFNANSMGIAVLGTFTKSNPPAAAVNAVAKLTAWKLGLFGANPRGKVTLVSGGSNKYKKGKKVKLNVISGHRDGFATECPGARLYKKLGSARTSSAKLQGR
ncbi:peptidoglycan recognition protein [Streptomyces sp. NBC_00264]|uniref:peptidoglycan recognition protein family protein n=1 Tax=unclassified Streptomyces TaxID=2593676 RepID=UPI002250853D|nr:MULTISPECIES: peptidoglycan recognition protein [unclassified Streptomyces]WSX01863.1 peptidoglycan recognition protein [Streptomyces sp. NBC_00987]MCX4396244.1 peptidoglycan recognition protein [Streptomyces sp. NBC_01767]MCX5160636.1 peptidoglycan recognition protein [Streptomyces sp. NBC_00305]MCX5219159.1 peptidoglycan recognition protein [Streptomyces sp. NBC_00264]WSC29843.1 peptidoglycan recognition protein [Streptomyces sp. NBC_01768]